jgi:hypothetical protein
VGVKTEPSGQRISPLGVTVSGFSLCSRHIESFPFFHPILVLHTLHPRRPLAHGHPVPRHTKGVSSGIQRTASVDQCPSTSSPVPSAKRGKTRSTRRYPGHTPYHHIGITIIFIILVIPPVHITLLHLLDPSTLGHRLRPRDIICIRSIRKQRGPVLYRRPTAPRLLDVVQAC